MLHLPPEILQQIFLELRLSGQTKADRIILRTLLNASVASKTIRLISEPALYHTIDYTLLHQYKIKLLLRTLIERPERCKHITTLVLTSWETSVNDELGDVHYDPPDEQMVTLYDQILPCLALPPELHQNLDEALKQGLEDADVALLIRLCYRLRKLTMQLPYSPRDSLVAMIINSEASSHQLSAEPLLTGQTFVNHQVLHEVCASHWDTEMSTAIAELTAFLRLPSLQTLRGTMLSCDCDYSLGGVQSTLESMILRESLVDAVGLEQILRACPKISKLHIHWGDAIVGTSSLEVVAIAIALRRFGTGLVDLELDVSNAIGVEDFDGRPLGDLSQLTSMKRLSLSHIVLFGQDDPDVQDPLYLTRVLPTSLQSLSIIEERGSEPHHDLLILRLMEHSAFQSLNKIRIDRQVPFSLSLETTSWSVAHSSRLYQLLEKDLGLDIA